jgi:hypothetical protein
MNIPTLSMKKFYIIAGILMLLSVIFSIWNLTTGWVIMNLPAKLSFIFGTILFQLLLVVLFFGMWKVMPDTTIKDNKELEELLETMKGGNK